MIIYLKRKKKFYLAKPTKQKITHLFGGGSPSEIKFKECCEKYGRPNRDGTEGEPVINRQEIAVFPNGMQFVRDCMTNRIIVRTSDVRYLGTKDGQHFWLGSDSEFDPQAQAFGSF